MRFSQVTAGTAAFCAPGSWADVPYATSGNFHGLDVLRENSTDWRDGIATTEAVSHAQGRSKLQAAQAVDAADWLSNDLLTKLDRCSDGPWT